MNFFKYVKQGIKILKLDRKAITKISGDEKATNSGIIILLIAGLLSVIGLYGIEGYYRVLIMAPIFTLVFFVLGVGMLHLFIRLLGGKTGYPSLFRVLSHAAIMTWLWLFLVIPIVGNIINLVIIFWGVVVTIIAVETTNGMTRMRAILAVLIPFVIAAIVVGIVVWLALQNYQMAI